MSTKTKQRSINPINVLSFVFQEERRSSLLLVLAAVGALYIANSPWSAAYFSFFEQPVRIGAVQLSWRNWINEALMAFFFLVVSLEVKRELVDGELKSWRTAAFPLIAALGGMVVPALIFSVFNPYPPHSNGWGIPMATDIAIAVGVLALLGRRVPKSLRIFLLSLAIIDDIGSIAIIGLFYNHPTNIFALLVAGLGALSLVFVRQWRLWPIGFLLAGIAIGYCLLLAGVSATMTGVVVALLMPLRRRGRRTVNLQASEIIEDILIPVTSFVIVPLFVFANAGLRFAGLPLSPDGGVTVFAGVWFGLLFGKPLGILSASWLAAKLSLAHKPSAIRWSHIAGVGFIAGIGFTVSLLVADLSYPLNAVLRNSAVLGIFTASISAGIVGLAALKRTLPRVGS